jgi:pilus assembly protein Flp/PilA
VVIGGGYWYLRNPIYVEATNVRNVEPREREIVRKIVREGRSLVRRDDGASAVEYGLLVALIAVIIAGTVMLLGNALSGKFQSACNAVANSTCAPH